MLNSHFQLQNFIIQASGTSQFNISTNGQFIVLRKIFSDIYPDFPDLITFKLYIYLCKSYEWKFKKIKKAKSQIRQELKLRRTDLDQSLLWLENNYFIKRTNTNKQQMYQAKILTAPDYDPFTNTFISCDDIPFSISELKDRNQGYIMIPANAITNKMLECSPTTDRTWTYFKLKIYLLLYAHCWLEYFGGIDPETIRINLSSNSIEVSPAFYYNAKGSDKEVVRTIKILLKMNLFKIVNVLFEKDAYIGDKALLSQLHTSAAERLVLRPFHLSDKKVQAPEMDAKRSFLII